MDSPETSSRVRLNNKKEELLDGATKWIYRVKTLSRHISIRIFQHCIRKKKKVMRFCFSNFTIAWSLVRMSFTDTDTEALKLSDLKLSSWELSCCHKFFNFINPHNGCDGCNKNEKYDHRRRINVKLWKITAAVLNWHDPRYANVNHTFTHTNVEIMKWKNEKLSKRN